MYCTGKYSVYHLCSGNDDVNGDRDIGSVDLWGTERACEKEILPKWCQEVYLMMKIVDLVI